MSDPLLWLRQRGNQAALRRFVERVTGRRMPSSTTVRWAKGERQPDACALALMAVLAEPGLVTSPPE